MVKLDNGSTATVRSMSFSDGNGYEILIPTVSQDGKLMSENEAIENYYKTGQHLGKFKNVDSASDYANRLHKQQEDYYLTRGY